MAWGFVSDAALKTYRVGGRKKALPGYWHGDGRTEVDGVTADVDARLDGDLVPCEVCELSITYVVDPRSMVSATDGCDKIDGDQIQCGAACCAC
jgi:hypothetical protein